MASTINANNTTGLVSTADTSGILQLQTNGTTAVTVDDSQRVAFVAGTAALPAITTTGDTNTGIFFPAADTIAFSEGGVEAMRIDSSGNVGIGTSSPTDTSSYGRALDIQSSTGAAIYLRDSDNPTTDYGLVAYDSSIDSLTLGSVTASAGIMRLITAGSERGRFNSDGSFCIGKTLASESATTGSGYGFASPTSDPFFSIVNANASGANACIYLSKRTTGAITVFQTNNGTTNTTVGTISTAASSTAYNTSSDYRLKHDIAPMTGALSRVALLKPVTYKWNVDNADGEGFIAHELAEVVPDCVTGEKDAVETVEIKDADGNVTGTEERPVYQGIDTSFLVATLTAAIQEQQAIIESLKARLDAANL